MEKKKDEIEGLRLQIQQLKGDILVIQSKKEEVKQISAYYLSKA